MSCLPEHAEQDGREDCPPASSRSGGDASRSFSPRLLDILAQAAALGYDDMCALSAFLKQVIFEKDRERASELQRHIGERCDVLWPARLEMKDALLTAVDVKKVTATVEGFPDVKPCHVPVYTVFLRPADSTVGAQDKSGLPFAASTQNSSSIDGAKTGGSRPGTAA